MKSSKSLGLRLLGLKLSAHSKSTVPTKLKQLVSSLLIALPISLLSNQAGAANESHTLTSKQGYHIAEINWQPCDDSGTPFECATFPVPLDYTPAYKNRGKTVELALARLPASDPENRQGSIFLNPGGPGSSGVNFVFNAATFLFNTEVRAQFDLVGFDPRGIGQSNPLRCFTNLEEQTQATSGPRLPETFSEVLQRKAADKFFAKMCRKNGGEMRGHMSTADVARDLEMLRRAVGDEKLNYFGLSYGSYLGVTYANLFPNKIRAMVIDGVLDPIAWATGRHGEKFYNPVSTRLLEDIGTLDTLNEFFRLCDSHPENCVFGGNSAGRFDAIIERLKLDSINMPMPDGSVFELTHANFLTHTVNTMYSAWGWEQFDDLLTYIEYLMTTQPVNANFKQLQSKINLASSLTSSVLSMAHETEKLPQTLEGYLEVGCSDSDNPKPYLAWLLAANKSDADNGYFGAYWTWISSTCARWGGPASDRYAGPFNAITNQPILIASNRYDPATPYHGAEVVRQLMPNSKLVTVNGWGHTTPFLSACSDQIEANYLLTGEMPNEDVVCEPNFTPFAPTTISGLLGRAAESRFGGNDNQSKRAILDKLLQQR